MAYGGSNPSLRIERSEKAEKQCAKAHCAGFEGRIRLLAERRGREARRRRELVTESLSAH